MFAMHSWRRSYTFVAIATLLIVAASDFFFYGHTIGWTAAAISAALLCLIAARDTRFFDSTLGRALTLAAAGLLVALVDQPTTLNIAYMILCLSGISLINTAGATSDFTNWLRRWTRWLSLGWTRIFLDNTTAVRWLVRRGFSLRGARGLAGWVIPVTLSAVFVAIFALANPIISDWFSRLGDEIWMLISWIPDLLNPLRMLFWLIAATATWMLLRGRIWRLNRAQPDRIVYETPERFISSALVVRCLILFNLIFAVENTLDVRFLYSEKLPAGMTYTEYVHRGAYPLVAAALLAGAFVLITFRPRSDTEKSPAARALVYTWIAQTIFLTFSAAWRLHCYIDMSELTRLRAASIVWFLLVATGLFYIVWRIVRLRSNAWLININALTALLVIYPCCFINFDGLIANFNAYHCAEAGGAGSSLDLEYFRTLGPTSVAALDRVRDHLSIPARRREADEVARDLHTELRADLADWRGWTWRRQRVAGEVEALAQARPQASRQYAHVDTAIAH